MLGSLLSAHIHKENSDLEKNSNLLTKVFLKSRCIFQSTLLAWWNKTECFFIFSEIVTVKDFTLGGIYVGELSVNNY